MTVDTINKANDLHKEINEAITIINHLKNRTNNIECIIAMICNECGLIDKKPRSSRRLIIINDETILVKMCDLLINEHTQKLDKLQQELDKL